MRKKRDSFKKIIFKYYFKRTCIYIFYIFREQRFPAFTTTDFEISISLERCKNNFKACICVSLFSGGVVRSRPGDKGVERGE